MRSPFARGASDASRGGPVAKYGQPYDPPAAAYGGAVASDAFPIISSPDLAQALRFYRDLLGAEPDYQFPEEGDPVFVGLRLGAGQLGLSQDDDAVAGPGGQRFSLWVYVDDCDATVEQLRDAGATVTEEPADQPWGERVARVLDFDGNEVILGQAGG